MFAQAHFKKYLYLSLFFISSTAIFAQSNVSDNVLTLDSLAISPDAKIKDAAWISGTWKGLAFGGEVEEIWSEPLGDSMMASFKLVVAGRTQFYEIEIIREKEGSLILQLKHFGGELKGWELKDETVDFKLVKITDKALFFDGMTFEKVNKNEMNVYVMITDKGKTEEVKFNYKKQQ